MALLFSCVVLSSQTSSSRRPRILMNELSLSCIFLMRSHTGPKAITERFTHRVLFSARVSYTFLPMRNRTLSPFSENLRAGAPSYPLEMTTSVAITLNIRCSFLAGAACYNMIYFNPFREETEKQKKCQPTRMC